MDCFDLPKPRQILFLISGPAGTGKTTLCQRLLDDPKIEVNRVVTATTRKPRTNEVSGVDYYFLSNETFDERINAKKFLESAIVHGNYYGTLRSEVERKFDLGKDLLLNIDFKGVQALVKTALTDPLLHQRVVTLFIAPRNLQVIRDRMKERGQDDPETIEKRLKTARQEMKNLNFFQYCLITGDRENDFERFKAIYLAEKMRRI